jgi:RecA/RadA recombinase
MSETIKTEAPKQEAVKPVRRGPGRPPKKPGPKPSNKTGNAGRSAKSAAAARNAIHKYLKQDPVAMNISQLPHLSTGSSIIDNLIGGSPAKDNSGSVCPGFPRKHVSEVYGPESSGKTTLALETVVSVQKAGGVAMFLDFEHALHHGYARAIGVDFHKDKLLLYASFRRREVREALNPGRVLSIPREERPSNSTLTCG